ncbi:MAG TPA: hypothetical protein VKA37_07095 [Halobacteriales archaeon]|nr:hypothetical protein [Halobacteriales archaeon]
MNSRLALDHADAVPSLETGVTLLSGGPMAVHRIVVSELAGGRTEALWVDPGMAVSVYALYDLVPSKRALAGLRVARAFTAYQHHSLVRELPRRASARTELVVLPGIADLYRDDDVPDYEREELFSAALAVCTGLADSLSVPVVVSDDGDDDLSALAADYADAEVAAESTDQGLAFRGAGFETLGYWGRDYWQTTIPYWVELFGAVDPQEPLSGAFGAGPTPGAEPAAELLAGSASPTLEG